MKKSSINIFLASFVLFLVSCSINKIHQINIPRSENTSKIVASSTKMNTPSSNSFDSELISTQSSSIDNSTMPSTIKLVKENTKLDKIVNVVLSQNQQLLCATKNIIKQKSKNEFSKKDIKKHDNEDNVLLAAALVSLVYSVLWLIFNLK